MEAWSDPNLVIEEYFVENLVDVVDIDIIEVVRGPHGRSRLGCRGNVFRSKEEGHEQIWKYYFATNLVYDVMYLGFLTR